VICCDEADRAACPAVFAGVCTRFDWRSHARLRALAKALSALGDYSATPREARARTPSFGVRHEG
jgi:hypothetical protein